MYYLLQVVVFMMSICSHSRNHLASLISVTQKQKENQRSNISSSLVLVILLFIFPSPSAPFYKCKSAVGITTLPGFPAPITPISTSLCSEDGQSSSGGCCGHMRRPRPQKKKQKTEYKLLTEYLRSGFEEALLSPACTYFIPEAKVTVMQRQTEKQSSGEQDGLSVLADTCDLVRELPDIREATGALDYRGNSVTLSSASSPVPLCQADCHVIQRVTSDKGYTRHPETGTQSISCLLPGTPSWLQHSELIDGEVTEKSILSQLRGLEKLFPSRKGGNKIIVRHKNIASITKQWIDEKRYKELSYYLWSSASMFRCCHQLTTAAPRESIIRGPTDCAVCNFYTSLSENAGILKIIYDNVPRARGRMSSFAFHHETFIMTMITSTEHFISVDPGIGEDIPQLIPVEENPVSLAEELCEQSMMVEEGKVVPQSRTNTPAITRSGVGDTINIHNQITVPVHVATISRHVPPSQEQGQCSGRGQGRGQDPRPPVLVPYYQLQGHGGAHSQGNDHPPALLPQQQVHVQGEQQPQGTVMQHQLQDHTGQGQGGGYRAMTYQDEYIQFIDKQRRAEQFRNWGNHVSPGVAQVQEISRPVYLEPRMIGSGHHHGNPQDLSVKPPAAQHQGIVGRSRYLHDQPTFVPHIRHSAPSDLQPRVFPDDPYGVPRNIHGATWTLPGVDNPSQHPALSKYKSELNDTLAHRARCNAEQMEIARKYPNLMYPDGMSGSAMISYIPPLTARTPYSAFYAKEVIPVPSTDYSCHLSFSNQGENILLTPGQVASQNRFLYIQGYRVHAKQHFSWLDYTFSFITSYARRLKGEERLPGWKKLPKPIQDLQRTQLDAACNWLEFGMFKAQRDKFHEVHFRQWLTMSLAMRDHRPVSGEYMSCRWQFSFAPGV